MYFFIVTLQKTGILLFVRFIEIILFLTTRLIRSFILIKFTVLLRFSFLLLFVNSYCFLCPGVFDYPVTVSTVIKTPFLAVKSHLSGNVHEVDAGQLYRSAQLKPKQLAYYTRKYGIKSIINLRGANPDKKWWQLEKSFSEKMSILHYDIPMSACVLTSKENLLTLLCLYKEAPRPILIHCQGGADRTGEAAALWKLEQQSCSKKEALEQLALRYGHFSCMHPAKRFLIEIWQGVEWLESEYDEKKYRIS